MPLRPRLHSPFSNLALGFSFLCLLMLFSSRKAAAQADPAEFKTQSISIFAGYLRNNIDYYPKVDTGVAFGLDLTRHIRFPLQPSIEGRADFASGSLANQRSYLVGLKADYRIRRFDPYVDYLVGYGTLHFNPAANQPILGDNSTVYSPGLGLDVDLAHHFRARIDFQHQYWNTGHTFKTEFQPSLLTLGVTYTLPFRPFHRQGEPHY